MRVQARHSVGMAGIAWVVSASSAAAHSGSGAPAGFVPGFLHPFGGLDHVAAMVAVGLWGSVLGAPAIWLLPVVFPLVMAAGGVLGAAGIAISGTETGIAFSALVLGIMVAGAFRPPLFVAAVLVGAFAIYHGHAHGSELPRGSPVIGYSAGFVVATGLLHLAGIATSLVGRWPTGRHLLRATGVAIGIVGAALLVARLSA